jgi:hypothetical protein
MFCAQVFVGLTQIPISRNQDTVTKLQKRAGVHQLAIAVHYQTRVLRQNSRYAKARCQSFGQRTGADVYGQMATAGKWVQTHIAQHFRESATGVIADQQNWQLCQRINNLERARFVRG